MIDGFQLAHFSRGRIHLKARALKRDRALAQRVHDRLLAVPGIEQVTSSALTGSLAIEYDSLRLRDPSASAEFRRAMREVFPAAFTERRAVIEVPLLKDYPHVGRRIEQTLEGVRGIEGINVDSRTGRVTVDYDADSFDLREMIEQAAR